MSELYKRYVDVEVRMQKDRTMVPLRLVWDDGRKYEIDKVGRAEKRASQVGGCGIRYEVKIHGQYRYLFFEKDRWFIESVRP
ncbi:MAG: hypothetical protein GX478_07995 [Erysipelotrichaceae bacterium]|jgi:hypothetical protein|nr:hypothetical protein [Erysipelotrichaceae bacterium]